MTQTSERPTRGITTKKAVIAAAALALALAGCSSGPDTKASYDAGYAYGNGFADPVFVNSEVVCNVAVMAKAEGMDQEQWKKGCVEGLQAKGAS